MRKLVDKASDVTLTDEQRKAMLAMIKETAVEYQNNINEITSRLPDCAWGSCRRKGTMSHTVRGQGPWFCREHINKTG